MHPSIATLLLIAVLSLSSAVLAAWIVQPTEQTTVE